MATATATLNSHVYAALMLHEQRDSTYLAIGRTSAWTDEGNPPIATPEVNKLDEVIGYKKIRQFSLARPLREGESPETAPYPVITYRSTSWMLVPREVAYEEGARYLYLEAELLSDEFPLGMYRQVGVHFGLEPNKGITKQNLLPEEVADTGTLHFYENRKPQNRTSNAHILEQFIVRT